MNCEAERRYSNDDEIFRHSKTDRREIRLQFLKKITRRSFHQLEQRHQYFAGVKDCAMVGLVFEEVR